MAAEFLRALNPHIQIIAHERRFDKNDAPLLAKTSAICEGSDHLPTKFLLNDLALDAGVPAFIVNGKYRVTGEKLKSEDEMLKVVDYLIGQERKARAAPAAVR